MNTPSEFVGLRKGLLELVVLKLIAAHKVYAADILQKLEQTDFATQEGTLYPLLSKLRRDEFVSYEWVESEAGPPRKYYALTAEGKTRLKQLEAYWQKISETINKVGA